MGVIQANELKAIWPYSDGYESYILKCTHPKYHRPILFKMFNQKDSAICDQLAKFSQRHSKKQFTEEELKIKKEKLLNIKELGCYRNDVVVLDLVYDKDKFLGYLMIPSRFEQMRNISSKRKLIEYLKAIREKIPSYNSNGVFIGDFSYSNILVSNDKKKDFKFCDLDNHKIDNLDFDSKTVYMQDYEKSGADPKYIDCYCYNIFTLSVLKNVCIACVELKDFYKNGCHELSGALNTKENMDIIHEMANLNSTYTPRYLIDSIK